MTGVDLNGEVLRTLNSGRSRIADGSSDDLADILSGGFRATADEAELPAVRMGMDGGRRLQCIHLRVADGRRNCHDIGAAPDCARDHRQVQPF